MGQSVSNEFDSKRVTDDGKIKSHRKMVSLADGSYSLEDELEIKGEGASPFVLGAGWLLELFQLESGEFYFYRGEEKIRPLDKRFAILYPPFSIVRLYIKNPKAHWKGLAGATETFPINLTTVPIIFETELCNPPNGIEQLKEMMDKSFNRQSIEINPRPSLLSIKAKRLIDENYSIYPSISRIAARLNVSHEHLSRQFKRDFLMSPTAYLHQVRVADATFRLSKGEEIIEVSQDVGYNDLSRFYKQFRKTTQFSPGSCRETMKKSKRA
jgi:AraC-like DNA-binding protein